MCPGFDALCHENLSVQKSPISLFQGSHLYRAGKGCTISCQRKRPGKNLNGVKSAPIHADTLIDQSPGCSSLRRCFEAIYRMGLVVKCRVCASAAPQMRGYDASTAGGRSNTTVKTGVGSTGQGHFRVDTKAGGSDSLPQHVCIKKTRRSSAIGSHYLVTLENGGKRAR